MGFFKKLFEKKDCEICGGEIGLLGNTKLSDGDMCRDCKAKLSPLFRVTDDTSVVDIKAQIAYREENKAALEAFSPNEMFGNAEKLHFDATAKKFAFTRGEDWRDEEPDLIDFAQVTDLISDIEEEECSTTDDNGTSTDYTLYMFHVTIKVNSPWFSEVALCLSEGDEPTLEGEGADVYRKYEAQMNRIKELLTAGK